MKISHVTVGILIVLVFLAGRWYLGNQSAQSASPAITGVGLRTQPLPAAAKERSNPKPQSSMKASLSPMSVKPEAPPLRLPQPPVMPDKPEVVRNNGPFIDPDPSKLTVKPLEPDKPIRNMGPIIDPSGPLGSNH